MVDSTKSIIKIDKYGIKTWRNSKGLVYRKNGPAIIFPNGSMHWCINNKRNRIDGPACVHHDGDKSWYLNDEFIREFSND